MGLASPPQSPVKVSSTNSQSTQYSTGSLLQSQLEYYTKSVATKEGIQVAPALTRIIHPRPLSPHLTMLSDSQESLDVSLSLQQSLKVDSRSNEKIPLERKGQVISVAFVDKDLALEKSSIESRVLPPKIPSKIKTEPSADDSAIDPGIDAQSRENSANAGKTYSPPVAPETGLKPIEASPKAIERSTNATPGLEKTGHDRFLLSIFYAFC
jgi:hypothetical protein